MYTFGSRIRYSETDSEGILTMASLINYFQDCSTFQSEDLGLGVECLQEAHLVWVLSSWQIVVERYPRLCERVTVGTLPYDMKGFLGYRNFAMLDEAGNYIAKANTLWSLLNTDTGKPSMIPEKMVDGYRLEEKLEMEYAPRKIVIPAGSVTGEALVVKKHHLDTNHHVNNAQYIAFAREAAGISFPIERLRADYRRAAVLGDVIEPRIDRQPEEVTVGLFNAQGEPYAAVWMKAKGEEKKQSL